MFSVGHRRLVYVMESQIGHGPAPNFYGAGLDPCKVDLNKGSHGSFFPMAV